MTEKIINNWKKAQNFGVSLPCPRCGKYCMNETSVTRNALSRRTDIYVCDNCGTAEALEDIPENKIQPMSLEDWYAVRKVRLKTNNRNKNFLK